MHNNYTTVLIGNGLGMALDPKYFEINNGLQEAWGLLGASNKSRIESFITDSSQLNNEEQLDKHYDAIAACLALEKIEKLTKKSWLIEEAKTFPASFRNFVLNTALYFFNYSQNSNQQFENFYNSLRTYIIENNTHVVTMNYDKLIYDRFCVDNKIMLSDNRRLMDGFFVKKAGFTPSALLDRPTGVGYYIHLHGSPLFYTDLESGIINKSKFTNFCKDIRNENLFQEHLILCATKRKPYEINQSLLLRFYWDFFKIALNQSSSIYIIGYSGHDKHVNEEISRVAKSKNITVIEYADQHTHAERSSYWSNQLNLGNDYFNEENLLLLQSILTYQFPNNKDD